MTHDASLNILDEYTKFALKIGYGHMHRQKPFHYYIDQFLDASKKKERKKEKGKKKVQKIITLILLIFSHCLLLE